MNKSSLKKFATNARLELLEKVELQARRIGITADSIKQADIESSDAIYIDGRQLSNTERNQRNKLISRIEEIGFDRVMEETSYTWFNRFVALRYMEVNDYLPTRVRILSSETDSAEPDMMKEALSLDLELDEQKIYEYKLNNQRDELFKYLIKMHCNDLNRYMPFMFETVESYTEILFPKGLLGTNSFVRQMTDTSLIPEDNWRNVEIVGWLYQYYISDENERVIKAKKRYKPEELPFATQLFTPEWIVRYMVQNSLGRYWTESHPEDGDLIDNWEFYLKNRQEDYQEKIKPFINKELEIEDIKCFDPAMGSGHILVYMFDILYEIYIKNGYVEREIPRLIIERNLYGLDIDDRAYQLASFSVVMKALQYNRRFLRSIERDGLEMNLASIKETNTLSDEEIVYLAGESHGENFEEMKKFINQFKNAKSIGSLIKIEHHNPDFLEGRLTFLEQQPRDLFEYILKEETLLLFKKLIKQSHLMNSEYDVFITNPPYAGNNYIPIEVKVYLEKNYTAVKTDLFSAFIDYSFRVTKQYGQMAFMSPYVWMFISSYEKLRKNIIDNQSISSLVQLEYSGFDGATVPVCSFVFRNYQSEIHGEYIRLSNFKGAKNQPIKVMEAVTNPLVSYRYTFNQKDFRKINGSPIAYWASEKIIHCFEVGVKLGDLVSPKVGLQTGDVKRFTRKWFEVSIDKVGFNSISHEDAYNSGNKWFPINNGGEYKKWYGNNEDIVNWENNGEEIVSFVDANGRQKSRPQNVDFYFQSGATWSAISSSNFSLRYFPRGYLFSNAGMAIFGENSKISIVTALLNSKVSKLLLSVINEGLNFNQGDVVRVPILNISDKHNKIITENFYRCIEISKDDWDSYELSWDFTKHPLLKCKSTDLMSSFKEWEIYSTNRFYKLKQIEENLNQIFIEIYDLSNEISSAVTDKSITLQKSNLERDIKSLISYFIGCVFGRYSLDEEGLIFAGGKLEKYRYHSISVDEDNILPILSDGYFTDDNDIVAKFIEFLKITFSEGNFEESLDFVAEAIGRRKNETARETLRRYFLNDFYKNHVQMYKKRPIYWLFTSGKEKAFNCLIYMHRYDKTTLSRIRTDYLHEVQTRMYSERNNLLSVISGDYTTKEINQAKKELTSLERKIDELIKYDELLHHMADQQIEIDLDDGVKVNYDKFKGLVGKI